MSISPVALSEAIKRIGKAFVYMGDPMTAGGLIALGATEGEITVEETFEFNDLTAPEYTGSVVHERDVVGQGAVITVPLVMPSASTVHAKLSPLGVKGGGFGKPQPVVTQTLLVIPQDEVGTGLTCSGAGVWTPAAPVHAVWLWRTHPVPGSFAFRHEDKGKVIREVTFAAMYDSLKPDGQRLYTIGDPQAVAIDVAV